MNTTKLLLVLEGLSRRQLRWLSMAMVVLVGLGDFITGPEISTSIFYVVPVWMTAWYTGRRAGLCMASLAGVIWLTNDMWYGPDYSHLAIYYWNGGVRLGLFLAIAALSAELGTRLRREQGAAAADGMTGLLNRRGFDERLAIEWERARRMVRPVTLAYLDLDNFKQVNDSRGHAEGDAVIRRVATVLRDHTRRVDAIARLGGDEFAVLYTETAALPAREAMEQLRRKLLAAMAQGGWPVTCSIGMVTFEQVPSDVHHMTTLADELMYDVKRVGKNAIRQGVWHAAATGMERIDNLSPGGGAGCRSFRPD